MKFYYLDLFAGAGGLSEGFLRAGFTPVAHIEKDRWAVKTLRTRLVYHYLKNNELSDHYNNYLKGRLSTKQLYSFVPSNLLDSVIQEEISENSLKYLTEKINHLCRRADTSEIHVIAGGPPCQVYSTIGRNRIRCKEKIENDPRTHLYRYYLEFLKKFRPYFFVFENVPGLLSFQKGKLWQKINALFYDCGYEVKAQKINAYDSGVLQKRERIIITGWRKEINVQSLLFNKETWHTKYRVSDVINDLPSLQPGQAIPNGEYYSSDPSEYLIRSGIRNGWRILTLHQSRNHNQRDRQIYSIAINKWNKERKRLKYPDLPSELKTHKNTTSFIDRFKVVAADLPYSHTVVAHLEKDGHYFIHPDITQLRSISVREAARLQSFPDDFYFEGPMTAIFRQIGNAVPPLMAEKIAKKLMEMLW